MNNNTRTIDLYSENDEKAVAALRDFNSSDYINKLFEECRNNDYRFTLDYFTSGNDDVIEIHYWDIRMIPDSCTYEVMFNEHYESLIDKFGEILKSDNPEDLADDLKKIYEQYLKPLASDDKIKEAYERYEYIGDVYAAYLMTIYAQRVFTLMKLGTPSIVINCEKRYFINAMIASSTWVSVIDKVDEAL